MTTSNSLNSSLRKYLPARAILGVSTLVETKESWLYNDQMGDPWWQGAAGVAYRWVLTADVYQSNHSSHMTRMPFSYTGLDIYPGMWVFADGDAKAVKIISILSQSDGQIRCLVEDVDRYNTFNDTSMGGAGMFTEQRTLVFFELGDGGLPMFDPIPPGITDSTITQIESRFRKFNSSVDIRIFQMNHGFKERDVLKIDVETRKYVKASSNDSYVIGTVSASGPGPNFFYLTPYTNVISNLSPGIPGEVGDTVWLGSDGSLSNTPGDGSPVYIKLTDSVKTEGVGSVANPQVWEGTSIRMNGVDIVFDGPEMNDLQTVVNKMNEHTADTHVIASTAPSPTVQFGSASYPSTAIAQDGALVFSINGVVMEAKSPSVVYGDANMVGWWDVIRAINEQTHLHGIYSMFDPGTGSVTLTNDLGGPIQIENISPMVDDILNFTSMLGVASDAGTYPDRLKLTRLDGGPISISNINGSFSSDFGIAGLANGSLPLAMVMDKSMSSNGTYTVPNVAARDAMQNMKTGDQVFVQSAEDSEWALFIRVSDSWIKLADRDSAATDANTISEEITHQSSSPVTLGMVSDGSRIVNVTVVVSEAFGPDATLQIGTLESNSAIMASQVIDLTLVGTYESSSSFTFQSADGDEGEILAFISPDGSTGKAVVIVSYL